MSGGSEEDAEMPDRSSKPVPAAPVGERRYTEEELALILNRAAERQEGVKASAPRYTLAEIQEIAAGAGISPEHVTSVAATIRDARAQTGGGVLGAPQRFRVEESIEGEVSDDVVGELLDLARRELGIQGTVTEALGAIDWQAQNTMGSTFVTITRRGGRTIIGVLSARTDAMTVTVTLGGAGAVAASAVLAAALVAVAGLAGPLVPLAAITGGTGGTWLTVRALWRRYARHAAGRAGALSAALVAAARRAVEDGRVRTS